MFEDDNYSDQTSAPSRNEPLIKLYALLSALLTSLNPTSITLTLRDGVGERLNSYIDELIRITNDQSLNDFRIEIHYLGNTRKPYVTGEAYARQLVGLVSYLFNTNNVVNWYCSPPPEIKYNNSKQSAISSPTTVHNHLEARQESTQTTNVQIEFNQTLLTLGSALEKLEVAYPDEASKENKFAKALRKALPTVKDSLGILASVLRIAGEIGLDPHTISKSLGL